MPRADLADIRKYVEENIQGFHDRRLGKLRGLELKKVLKRKNPYLYKAKNVLTAGELVKGILDAFLSSQEEAVFGEFLEGLAIYICRKTYGGRKSSAEGIDLEFEKDGIKYIVAIKSGPNWGNSSQIKKMEDCFRRAKRILGGNRASRQKVVAVNGCCYGKDEAFEKAEYQKFCGQRFWSFISGSKGLYLDIIEPLGHRAKEKNEAFMREYAQIVNRFTAEFIDEFCSPQGAILWPTVVRFNSGQGD